jgi:D-inositol-3-phosphate glycosyltransferase
VSTVTPGVDLERFRPGDRLASRRRFGLAPDAEVMLFVGRIQPLKAPDVLLHAAADMLAADPALRDRLVVVVCGGPSGTGLDKPEQLQKLAAALGIADIVRFVPPLPPDDLAALYRAADVTVVPSHNESFGLVAVESQACGTPVVAAAVGGLVTAVSDGVSGVLVDGHDPARYAEVLSSLVHEPRRRRALAAGAADHAARFSWQRTADGLLTVYGDALQHERELVEAVS